MSSWTPEMAERARAIIAGEVSYARHEPLDLLEAALERIAELERARSAGAVQAHLVLFTGDRYYAAGGANDATGVYPDTEAGMAVAMAAGELAITNGFGWAQIARVAAEGVDVRVSRDDASGWAAGEVHGGYIP